MREFVKWLPKARSNSVMGSCVTHTWLAQIHPFSDGNGRLARAVAEAILRASGLPPVIIPASERDEYLQLMEQAWTDIGPLEQFWGKHFEAGLKYCRAMHKGRRRAELADGAEPNIEDDKLFADEELTP